MLNFRKASSRGPAPPGPRPSTFYHLNPFRTLLFGHPVETEAHEDTLLPKVLALPVFSSDAISSVAYATQQILLAFGAAGLAALSARQVEVYGKLTMGVTAAIVFLLVVVVSSYWQTIFGYPSGGGSYIVSKANLGPTAGLVAGAALLIDYVLTVAVSIASGVQNFLSTPLLQDFITRRGIETDVALVAFCLVFILILTVANLRGLKESGTLFALPTYMFIGMASLMILLGIFGPMLGWNVYRDAVNQKMYDGFTPSMSTVAGVALVGLVLKAFANGCSAMTGVEAVSNGIPAFRAPKSRNAAVTLIMMACILGFLFLGISWLATQFHVVYWENGKETAPPVIDQLSSAIFGKPEPGRDVGPLRTFLYYCMQFSTTLILLVAANTSYADFPRLASIMARDRYMPRPLANLGDKLVFSNGIAILGFFSALLVLIFHGSVDNLIPLYAVGVFTAFTLSQAGMVRHWLTEKGPLWLGRAAVNGVGAVLTSIVLLNILYEKCPETWTLKGFLGSSWIVVLLAVVFIAMFKAIHRHYQFLDEALTVQNEVPLPARLSNTVLILVPSLHRGIRDALAYARCLSQDTRAIHIQVDAEETSRLKAQWEGCVGDDVPLVILESPFRSLTGPLVAYVDEVRTERNHVVTVILPEFVSDRLWHAFLHNNSALQIRWALLNRPGVVVANARYFVSDLHTRLMYTPPRELEPAQ